MSALLEQKCPCCGGAVEFNAGTQNLKCPYCDSEFDISQLPQTDAATEVGEDSINWNSCPSDWQNGENENVSVYVCNSCGGEIIADRTTGASTCPYCDNPVVMKGHFSGDLRPDFVIPFKFDKNAAKQALIKHVSGKKFVPAVFKDRNHIDEIKGVYVPHWLFSGTAVASANFNAQRSRSWSDSNYRYTETEYFNAFRSGNLDFSNVPVDGSSKMDDTLMESIEPFNTADAVDFNTAYLAGFLADKYDVDMDSSIARANERVRKSAVSSLRNTVKNFTVVTEASSQVSVENGSCRYALYPVWLLNTSWNGEKYTFAMNGQTGKFVGNLPIDKKAVMKWTGILTPFVSAAVFAFLYFFF